MSDVFISYARADSRIAQRISHALQEYGFTVFLDSSTLVAGEDVQHQITKAISSSSAVIAILSVNSKRSNWVEDELQSALEAEKVIIPVLLDDEGKDNWVWPLISDRIAFRLTDDSSADELVRQLSTLLDSGRAKQPRLVDLMRDKYEVGQVGAIGRNALNKIWQKDAVNLDVSKLAEELMLLRSAMQGEARTAEDFAELGAVASAEIEAKKGNGPTALAALSKTGKWSLAVAEKIGVKVAAAALISAIGIEA